MFEFTVKIPVEKDLVLRVKDYDLFSGDDVIGETKIDLENRLMTFHRAYLGLPETYLSVTQISHLENITGNPLVWRDNEKPSEILKNMVQRRKMGQLTFVDEETIELGEHVFKKSMFPTRNSANFWLGTGKKKNKVKKQQQTLDTSKNGGINEQLCLDILNLLDLVPEHVERRPLFSDAQPGVEQGRVHMWLDMYPGIPAASLPMPRDIRPRKPVPMVLRCIVWNTLDVVLADTSLTGEKMVDIYVKAWLKGLEEHVQETDVHYR